MRTGHGRLRPPAPIAACTLALLLSTAFAAEARPSSDARPSHGARPSNDARPKNLVAAHLHLARPVALETGMMLGFAVGYSRGHRWAWGVRASWATATEYTKANYVLRHDDLRLRALGALQVRLGRGQIGLRLLLGLTLVHEDRSLWGGLEPQASWDALPGVDLEPFVVLRLWRGWGVGLRGGPSLHLVDAHARLGWTCGLGVTWQG